MRALVTALGALLSCVLLSLTTLAAVAHAQEPEGEGKERTRLNLRVTADKVSLEEIGRLVPAVGNYTLPPGFRLDKFVASGPLEQLSIEFEVVSRSGDIAGQLVADVTAPRRAVNGTVRMKGLNLARLLDRRSLPAEVTATATIDLRFDEVDGRTSITGTYRANGSRVTVANFLVTDFVVRGRMTGDRVVIEEARAASYGSRVSAAGFVVLPEGDRPISYRFSGNAAGIDLRRLPPSLGAPRLASSLDLDYRVSSTAEGFDGGVEFREGSVLVGAEIHAGTTARFSVSGSGPVAYAARGTLSGLDLRKAGAALDIGPLEEPRFESLVNAEFDLEGRGSHLDPVSARLVDSRLFGGTIPEMQVRTSISHEELRFEAQGSFSEMVPGVALQSGAFTNGAVTGTLDVSGSINRAGGFDPASLVLEGKVILSEGRYEDIRVDEALIEGAYRNSAVVIRKLTLSGEAIAASVSGTLDLAERGQSSLDYQFEAGSMESLAGTLGAEVHGSGRLEGQVTGSREALRVRGILSAGDFAYGAVSAAEIKGEYDARIPSLELSRASLRARVEGGDIDVAGRAFSRLAADVTYIGKRAGFDVSLGDEERLLEARGAFVLHPDHSEVHLDGLALQAAGSRWTLPASSPAAIRYGDERITVEGLRLQAEAGQEISIDGTVGPGSGPPLRIHAADVELSNFDAVLMSEHGLAGRLDLTAEISGPLSSPRATGKWNVRGGALRGFHFESWAGEARYDGDTATIDTRLNQTPTSWLTARGSVPVAALRGASPGGAPATPEWNVRIESSSLDLALVESFTDRIGDVTGIVEIDALISGPAQSPGVGGAATVRNGAFSAGLLGTRYSGLHGRLSFEGETVLVEYLSVADDDEDPLLLAGRLPIRGGGDVSLQVQSEDFDVFDARLGAIAVDARLLIGGALTSPVVRGDIRVARGEINVDVALRIRDTGYATGQAEPEAVTALKEGRKTIIGAEKEAGQLPTGQTSRVVVADRPEGLLRGVPIDVDVVVVIPDNLLIRGQDLRTSAELPIGFGDVNITMGGKVRVLKPRDEGLRLRGEVRTVRGLYEFQGRQFEIVRAGTIVFTGQEQIDAVLDLSAERVISGVRAQVNIGGTLSAPTISLSSIPAQDESDIFSLIVFNVPANQLGAAQKVSLSERATALVGGFVGSKVAQTLGSALHLDLLDIQTGQRQGGPGATVTVGEQIGDLYVKFRQGIGPESVSEVLLEYRIRDWLRLQSSVAQSRGVSRPIFRRVEQGGIDAVFFFSY